MSHQTHPFGIRQTIEGTKSIGTEGILVKSIPRLSSQGRLLMEKDNDERFSLQYLSTHGVDHLSMEEQLYIVSKYKMRIELRDMINGFVKKNYIPRKRTNTVAASSVQPLISDRTRRKRDNVGTRSVQTSNTKHIRMGNNQMEMDFANRNLSDEEIDDEDGTMESEEEEDMNGEGETIALLKKLTANPSLLRGLMNERPTKKPKKITTSVQSKARTITAKPIKTKPKQTKQTSTNKTSTVRSSSQSRSTPKARSIKKKVSTPPPEDEDEDDDITFEPSEEKLSQSISPENDLIEFEEGDDDEEEELEFEEEEEEE